MVGNFTRKATGLVRQARASDVFIYNVNFINIAIGVAFMLLFMPTDAYPGVNMYVSTLVCFLAVVCCSLVYAMFAGAMPRSGGEYVYVSRSLSPVWGFVANWNYTIWSFLYIGIPAAFLGKYGISSLFRSLGAYFEAPHLVQIGDWFTSPLGVFVSGAVLIILYVILFSIGINVYMRLQLYLFILASVGLVAILVVFATYQGSMADAFNLYMSKLTGHPDAYSAVLQGAGPAPEAPGFSWHSTLSATTWPFTVLGFSIASAYIGGEIKGANRAQLIGMPGSLVYSTVWILVLVWAVVHVAGLPFLRALDTADLQSLGIGFTPTFAEIGAMLTSNLLLILLMGVGFLLWTFAWMPIYILTTTRNLMAWALDGLAPGKLSAVSDRTHAPVWSIGVSGLLGLILLYVYAYTPSFATIAGFFGQVFTFLLTSVAAIVFPFRQKAMFEASPINWRFGGVPVLSILGAISIIGLGLIEWAFLNDPNSGISVAHPTMLLINVAVFLSGFVYYGIVRWIRSRQGIDLGLVFQEIPPE
ncbi:APC family permease [Kyrpidia sp.]|uniref:APC family permease n=1 Tax=Kyrpidia sp. TaxID=2073077 RepID=UPI0017F124BC|nr:APC family permease [Kyrpidia sp.]MCL6576498.1 APC family permease [Kyrpidia sp.]HHY65834.1 APC family permease [Alicyclobacillus sp.]